MLSRQILSLLVLLKVAKVCLASYGQDWSSHAKKYGSFSEAQRLQTLDEVKDMFYFGYNNYVKHAFPKDELDPIHCTGRGPDYDDPYVLLFQSALLLFVEILHYRPLPCFCTYVLMCVMRNVRTRS